MHEKIDEADLKFVTHGTMARDTYQAFVDATLKKSVLIKLLACCDLSLIVCGAWSAVHRVWLYLALCIGGLFVFGAVPFLLRTRSVNLSMQRLREVYGIDTWECMTGFTNEAVYSENKNLGTGTGVTYENLARLYNTKRFLFLTTKGALYVPVFKDGLSSGERQELYGFLKQKGVRIKKRALSY
ncbi:MAG: hypothetical protein LUD69_08400 [Oscillospiraceae bacterium]|nr:hypothetical protein [Oscillospiraceae bacterium]